MTHHVETHNGPVVHTGGYLQMTGALFNPPESIIPKFGTGVELLYVKDNPNPAAANGYGLLQAYSRDTSTYRDLVITGRTINLSVPAGGKVYLPAESANAFVGGIRWIGGWDIPQVNVWNETPVQVTATLTGRTVRVEACGSIKGATNALIYMGFGVDGTCILDSMTAAQVVANNVHFGWAMVGYFLPSQAPAGVRRISVFMYSNVAGSGFWTGAYNSLYVTEQRA